MKEQPTTALATSQRTSPLVALGERFQIEPNKLIEVLRGTVIKPTKDGRTASNEELAAFCMVANQYKLNPFTREIHAFADPQKGVVPIVGIDGWANIVNAQQGFDGCEFTDEGDAKGAPVSITCAMFVKGRGHPVKVTERFAECKRNTIPWQTMPWRMLRHKAYMQAARIAFSLSGIFDEDEARDIVRHAEPTAPKPIQPVRLDIPMPETVGQPPEKANEIPPDLEPLPPEEEAQVPFEVPSPEAKELIDAIRTACVGLPRRLAKACQKYGIDKDEMESAPLDGLRKVLAAVESDEVR